MREKLIIAGSEGTIGKILTEKLPDNYDVYGIDKDASQSDRKFRVDITDFEALQKVFEQLEPVSFLIHLAADPRVDAPWESVLQNNIIGTRNVYECARNAGVKRVVFASSNHVTGAYEGFPPTLHTKPHPKLISPSDPIRPDSYYGTSKSVGETIARQFYELYGIHSICLRIGTVTREDDPTVDERMKKTWLSHRDLVHLIRQSLTSSTVFGVYYGVSNNDGKFWSIANARKELGYNPQDNAAMLK